VKLNYKILGHHEEVLVVLHGLMGMLDNWHGPAKAYTDHFTVYLVDARNHGHSPHSPDFNYDVMTEDLLEFLEDHGLEDIHLMGHSMGGKTVMKFAQNHAEYVKKLVVADIAPKEYPVHHQTILKALRNVDFSAVSRRSEVDPQLAVYIPEWGVRQFLLKNIYWKEKAQLDFRFNLDAIESNIELIGAAIEDQIFRGQTLFIRGEKSDYVQEEDWSDIELMFPAARLETIKDAGHWLHADQPEQFNKSVIDFLLS
jgi:pimeloyl-ACP methyl ester carboxylesterase